MNRAPDPVPLTADPLLNISVEIQQALLARRAVVALESSVIAHGLPSPTNLEVARRLEAEVRQAGALPATVALIDGRIRVGCTDAELELLATSRDVRKVSRRDLPIALGLRQLGATTVAGTLICAQRAGIAVVATGGIGAVARDGHRSWDVSNDLVTLAQASVALVCAGAKSLMDARLSRELLETLGISVVGWQTDDLPAFYCRSSGERVDIRVEVAADAAAIIAANRALGLPGSVLIVVPPPSDVCLQQVEVESAVEVALGRARLEGSVGAQLTPFVLDALAEITEGRSRRANVELLAQNARVAGEIAVALARQAPSDPPADLGHLPPATRPGRLSRTRSGPR